MAKKSTRPSCTVEEIQSALQRSRIPNDRERKPGDGILLRPCDGATNFVELDFDLVMQAFDEIVKKIPMAQIGFDRFTKCETLVFMLFRNHAIYGV